MERQQCLDIIYSLHSGNIVCAPGDCGSSIPHGVVCRECIIEAVEKLKHRFETMSATNTRYKTKRIKLRFSSLCHSHIPLASLLTLCALKRGLSLPSFRIYCIFRFPWAVYFSFRCAASSWTWVKHKLAWCTCTKDTELVTPVLDWKRNAEMTLFPIWEKQQKMATLPIREK